MITASVRWRRKHHLKTVQCAEDGNQNPGLNLDLIKQRNIGVDGIVDCSTGATALQRRAARRAR